MKNFRSADRSFANIAILFCLTFMSSCLGEKCWDPQFSGLTVFDYSLLHDSALTITKYKNGTHFTDLIDSTRVKLHTGARINLVNYAFNGSYSYRVRLYPSGKIYEIRDITVTSDDRASTGIGEQKGCINSSSYYLNDSLIILSSQKFLNNAPGDRYKRIEL